MKKSKPVKMNPVEQMKKFGGQQRGQNFKDGRHDRNGVDRSTHTGCCDAERDAHALVGNSIGEPFDKFQYTNNGCRPRTK